MNTHEPLPGIDVGDIGPKMGTNGTDNGFLGFKNCKIPKNNMLRGYSRINEQGEYELLDPNALKILFLSLLNGRMIVIKYS